VRSGGATGIVVKSPGNFGGKTLVLPEDRGPVLSVALSPDQKVGKSCIVMYKFPLLIFMIFCFVISAFILSFAGSLLTKKKKLSGFLQRGTKVRDSLSILLFAIFQICIGARYPALHEILFIFWTLEKSR
jgi:hypothetical protein